MKSLENQLFQGIFAKNSFAKNDFSQNMFCANFFSRTDIFSRKIFCREKCFFSQKHILFAKNNFRETWFFSQKHVVAKKNNFREDTASRKKYVSGKFVENHAKSCKIEGFRRNREKSPKFGFVWHSFPEKKCSYDSKMLLNNSSWIVLKPLKISDESGDKQKS